MQNYHKPYMRETGKHVQYDIAQLRQAPEKLEARYKQRANGEIEQQNTHTEVPETQTHAPTTNKVKGIWEDLQKQIYTGLTQCYPPPNNQEIQKTKRTKQKKPTPNVGNARRKKEIEQWQEKQLEHQAKIAQLDTRLCKMPKQLLMLRTLQAWKLMKETRKQQNATIKYQKNELLENTKKKHPGKHSKTQQRISRYMDTRR